MDNILKTLSLSHPRLETRAAAPFMNSGGRVISRVKSSLPLSLSLSLRQGVKIISMIAAIETIPLLWRYGGHRICLGQLGITNQEEKITKG